MNSSFPPIQTLMPTLPDRQRPFQWIGELAAFFRRNRHIVLVCTATTMFLALAYTLTARPQFTASTILFIDEGQSQLLQQHPAVADAQIENARIESEVEVLRSAGLARKVVARLGLADDPGFNQSPSLPARIGSRLASFRGTQSVGSVAVDAGEERRAAQFLSMVVPHRIGLTYVIEIDATATNAALAARLANGLADAYVAEQLEVKEAAARQANGWLQARLLQLQDQALKADQAAQSFKAENGIVDTGHGLLNEQQLTELTTELVAARGRTAQAVARLDRIRQMTASRGGAGLATSDMLQNSVINGLQEHYLRDAQRVAEWSARYGHDHEAAILLRREMVQLQTSIDSEMRRIGAAAESDVVVDHAGEAALQAQLDAVVGRSAGTDRARATFRSLQSAADTYRSLYVAFLQSAMQTAQEQSFPVADVRIVTQARPPLTKSRPQGKLILVGATVLGLGMGFILGLLRDALDRRIRDASDLADQTGLSCLASLPVVGAPRRWTSWRWREPRGTGPAGTAAPAMRHHAVDHPDTPFGRGISRLQLRLQQRAGAGGRVIGLIAPTDGAGTTTVAVNLVGSFSRSGHDTALLDLSRTTGSGAQIRGRLDLLRRSHDVVVIDFPPLARPGEAHTVFRELEEVVLLVDAARFDGAALLDSLRDAGLDRRTVSGVVLNKVPDRGPASTR